ncbi:MAG: oxidoreductase [Lentisphaerae bacterium]|nr:oxidoreductase [Lentisphaerota bacterium]
MNPVYSKAISCYASDTAGVCSALFELGGMTVVHDASGCNSTYSTFDEPRWYNSDSMTYISALTEKDVVCGNDDKLIDDIVRAAGELHPAFIMLTCSVIPFMTGCDLDAIAREVENSCHVPAFAVTLGGMTHYTVGMNQAYCRLAERFLLPGAAENKIPRSVNILGATPLDLPMNGTLESLKMFLQRNDFSIQSIWSMGSTLDELARSAGAEVNLVISSGAVELAEYMFKEYNIPFVCAQPIGVAAAERVLSALEEAIKLKRNTFCLEAPPRGRDSGKKYIIGESVFARSLAVALQQECNWSCCVIDPLAGRRELLTADDLQKNSETELELAIADAELVIADNMYEVIVPENAQMLKIPHTAFSGRCYRKQQLDLIDRTIDWESLLCRK